MAATTAVAKSCSLIQYSALLPRINTRNRYSQHKLKKILSGVKLDIDIFVFRTRKKCLGVLGIIFKSRHAAVLHQTQVWKNVSLC